MGSYPIELTIGLLLGAALTWFIFILALAKFHKYCNEFSQFRKNVDTNVTGISTNIRKMQLAYQELIVEQRRTNKLMIELIEAQKNSNPLSGLEYELVEEEEIIED